MRLLLNYPRLSDAYTGQWNIYTLGSITYCPPLDTKLSFKPILFVTTYETSICENSIDIWMLFMGNSWPHGLTFISAWMSNYIHYKMWDEITYPFPNFNGATFAVCEWISNFIPYFTWHVIIYPCWKGPMFTMTPTIDVSGGSTSFLRNSPEREKVCSGYYCSSVTWLSLVACIPDSKVHGAYMGPNWGQHDPGGPHVGPMTLAIRVLKLR